MTKEPRGYPPKACGCLILNYEFLVLNYGVETRPINMLVQAQAWHPKSGGSLKLLSRDPSLRWDDKVRWDAPSSPKATMRQAVGRVS